MVVPLANVVKRFLNDFGMGVKGTGFLPDLSKRLVLEVQSMRRKSSEAAEAARVNSIKLGAIAVKLVATTITDKITLVYGQDFVG